MTHFCPVRREGKSCWEVSGKSLLSLETALGRYPLLLLCSVTAGRASRKGPHGPRTLRRVALERAGRGLQASVRVGAVICMLLRCQDVHTWRRTCVSTKLASTLHMGGFPSRFFPSLLWRSSTVLSCHKKFIASPLLKSAQPSLLGFKVTALQINTYEYELLDITSFKKKEVKTALFRWEGVE